MTDGSPRQPLDPERQRLQQEAEGSAPWSKWGPYLSERQWGTVREDYSPDGTAWESFPHDHARSRAYRWGEDGLLGISDKSGKLCFALSLWNGADPILKERLFGLTGNQGNHGEDVKEYYYYLDNVPSHAYMRALYRYPQRAFPYDGLLAGNRGRDRSQPEYELLDTGVFDNDRYFDVEVEYAKASPTDIAIRVQVTNRGPEPATLHVLPTLWFRNTWSWGYSGERPALSVVPGTNGTGPVIAANHPNVGQYWLAARPPSTTGTAATPDLLFTENETNYERLWGVPNRTPYVKDAIGEAVVHGRADLVNPARTGTKAAVHYLLTVAAGATESVDLRLSDTRHPDPFADIDSIFKARRDEADAFYLPLQGEGLGEDGALVQRQAFAGLLWTKQFYHYDVEIWLTGDPAGPTPPASRLHGRNSDWRHLNNDDILAMPDTWEYPWYAAWDLAFHCIPMALIDPAFAKGQLILLLREWYMQPNGQLPAYEWAFDDVNPPVHAWAALRVYRIERRVTGHADREFLERVFQKLLLNFTWWVNRKDSEGNNVFEGGFLGLDNVGVFDRSKPLPGGEHLEQADGTAWMGTYCLNMLAIALELAESNPVYEDLATKFFEHFLYIAGALNNLGGDGIPLWDEEDQFFYDVVHFPNGSSLKVKVRSVVGLIPLRAVETFDDQMLERLPMFAQRMRWFLDNRPDLARLVAHWEVPGQGERHMLALVRGHRLKALLERALDPEEFLSDHGIRSLSRYHRDHPFKLEVNGTTQSVDYEPAESTTPLFGGNSNWRGPVWFPINYLVIEALQRFHFYYGDDFLVECPTGSGKQETLWEISQQLSRRLAGLFLRDASGKRPVFGSVQRFQDDPNWRDHILFHEYFDGDTGAGLGASHQTGWTALVAKLLEQQSRWPREAKRPAYEPTPPKSNSV